MNKELLERFIRYAKVFTPSNEANDAIPSSQCQFDLADMLADEMNEMGMEGVFVDKHCYVYGFIPATAGLENVQSIAFIAHLDTVSDYCSKAANPVVHMDYDGEDVELEGGVVIKTANFPHLKEMKGRTIITSDGTTILGADDKAGIAEIMTFADEIIKSGVPHGRICIAFTPDEEIGSGARLLDLERLGADYAFTLDGDIEGGIEYETFNAAAAKVSIHGVNVHPGSAKDIMVNSAVVACEFNAALPEDEQPRTTSGYQGFYHLTGMSGDVEKAEMSYIIRDHDRKIFEERKAQFGQIADLLNSKYGAGTVSVLVTDTYFNMAEILKDRMEIVETAIRATKKAGLTPSVKPVRGGTDGSSLSFRGLPCPNLATGGAGYHGPYEHISLEGMEYAVEVMKNIVRIAAESC